MFDLTPSEDLIASIEEKSSDIYLYHYTPVVFDAVCPTCLIPNLPRDTMIPVGIESNMVSFLTQPFPIEKLQEMKDNGFKQYQNFEQLYLCKIRLSDIIDKMAFFTYESQRDAILEVDKNWDKEKKHIMSIGNNITDVEFQLAKMAMKARYYHKHKLIYSSGNENDFKRMIRDANKNFLEDVDYNIQNGSKRQYATYVPHFRVMVRACIPIVESVAVTGS